MSYARTSIALYPYTDTDEQLAMLLARGSGMPPMYARKCVSKWINQGEDAQQEILIPIQADGDVGAVPAYATSTLTPEYTPFRTFKINVQPGAVTNRGGKFETYG